MNYSDAPLVGAVTEVIADALDLSGQRVLDVGCGDGALVRWLAGRGAKAAGLETQADLVEKARSRAVGGESYHHGRGESLPFADGTFDAVVFSYSLHHVPADAMRGALAEARRVLVDEGRVLVVEPVADGDYFAVMKIVDDETRVRHLAFEALNDTQAHGLSVGPQRFYRTFRVFDGPAAMLDQIVRVDPARRDVVEAHRDRLYELFFRHGRAGEKGYRFEMAIRSNLLLKSGSRATR